MQYNKGGIGLEIDTFIKNPGQQRDNMSMQKEDKE